MPVETVDARMSSCQTFQLPYFLQPPISAKLTPEVNHLFIGRHRRGFLVPNVLNFVPSFYITVRCVVDDRGVRVRVGLIPFTDVLAF